MATSQVAELAGPSNQQAETQAATSQAAEHSQQAEVQSKNQPNMTSLRIFTNNCRGYTCKKESVIKYVIDKLQPDVINFEETLLKNKTRINLENYFSFCQNRPEGAGGGGIATMVSNSIKSNATKIAQNNQHDEYMVVRLDHIKPALNIFHIYGQVEKRAGPEKVLEGWTQILQELGRIEATQEAILIVGDLNRAIGDDDAGVEGNKKEVSYGGGLVRNLIMSKRYFILNNLSLTKGGPWTRICPGAGTTSCLDLAIGSANLLPFVSNMLIDSKRLFTPRRVVGKTDGALTFTFTDHYPLVIDLEMPKAEKVKERTEPHWNTHKPGVWNKYREVTDSMAEKIEKIIDNDSNVNEEVMEKIEKIQNKIKHITFGKTKPKTEKALRKESEVNLSESEEAKQLMARMTDKMESQVAKVRATKNGRVTQIFGMKDIVAGKRKTIPEAQAIEDPETGDLVVSNAEIKKVTLKYCLKTLEKNEPEEEVKELVKYKEEVHKLRMEDRENDEEFFITDKDFFMTLSKFESTNSTSYDFITKAGIKFKLAVFKLCKRLIESEIFPSRFNLTTLVQLHKKGSARRLENHRFLHLKEWPAKLTEALAVRGMKADIFKAGTKFQIGGCPGQRTVFHLFVIKSLIALRLKFGEACFLTLLDIIKYFDKQSLVDACDALFKAKVNNKLFRVWYKLNEHTEIQVRMGGGGLSARGLAGPVTGQGGKAAALASALNLDLGVNSYFHGSKDEESYGTIRLQPLSYCDDLIRATKDMNTMRAGNFKFSSLAAGKQLSYHPSKSCYLVFGSEQTKAKARIEADEEPVMLGKMILTEKQQEKYLGDILDSRGLKESVKATIKDRTGKVKGSIYELRAVIEDFRMQAVGGTEAAIDLYEACIVPSLLSNCSTWMEIDQEAEDMLDAIQDLFGRVLMQLPASTPRLAIRGALGLLGMKWRVWKEKLLLILALQEQEEGGLARDVLGQQLLMAWPGLGQEVKMICKEVGLPDITLEAVTVTKEAVTEAVKYNNLKQLKLEMQSKGQKLKQMSQTDMSRRRAYLKWSLEEARMALRLETFMFDCRSNMPAKYNRDLKCRACLPAGKSDPVSISKQPDEDQEHLECCNGFAQLWQGLGSYDLQARCQFFMKVKLERLKKQQHEKQQHGKQQQQKRQ